MIDYLKGKVLKKYGNAISLLCGPVGFKVMVPLSTLSEVEEGEEVSLFYGVLLALITVVLFLLALYVARRAEA